MFQQQRFSSTMTAAAQKMPRFPAGLRQPEGSARFSLDALLLAAYAAKNMPEKTKRKSFLAVELGCGCGAALLGFAMLVPNGRCRGIELESSLVASARANAEITDLVERCEFYQADLNQPASELLDLCGNADIILANPPWRKSGEGRTSASPLRRKAHWANDGALRIFLAAAEKFLMRHGRFCLILPPARLGDFFSIQAATSLGLREILPVSPFRDAPANRLLMLCQKKAANDISLKAPLVIHEKNKFNGQTGYTRQAGEFCPWLRDSGAIST